MMNESDNETLRELSDLAKRDELSDSEKQLILDAITLIEKLAQTRTTQAR